MGVLQGGAIRPSLLYKSSDIYALLSKIYYPKEHHMII